MRSRVVRAAVYLGLSGAAGCPCKLAAAQPSGGDDAEATAGPGALGTASPKSAPPGSSSAEAAPPETVAPADADSAASERHDDVSAHPPAPGAATSDKPPRPSSLSLPSKPSDSNQPLFGTFEGTYALAGLSTGITFAPAGFVVGAELSLVRQTQEFAWFGAYADGVYDFGREQWRLSIGPELGWSAFGLDAGYLLALDDAGAHNGLTARPLVSIGYVAAFGRVSHLFDVGQTWFEAGLLLKYPVEL